jgi:hypothetical protein
VVPAFAAWNQAMQALNTDSGSCRPPADSSSGAATKPVSAKVRSAVPTSGTTSTVRPSKRGSCRSAARLWGAKVEVATFSASSSIAPTVSAECSR